MTFLFVIVAALCLLSLALSIAAIAEVKKISAIAEVAQKENHHLPASQPYRDPALLPDDLDDDDQDSENCFVYCVDCRFSADAKGGGLLCEAFPGLDGYQACCDVNDDNLCMHFQPKRNA